MKKQFTQEQLDQLRAEYGKLETVNPDRLESFHRVFDMCADEALRQLALAKVKFVSLLAVNACVRRKIALNA